MGNNKLTKIENLENLTNLQVLYLNSNQLTKIENLGNLTNFLYLLDLGNNKLAKIENLEKLINLHWLHLGKNQFTKIENLEKLTNLEGLYLNLNELAKIENLEKLTNLRTLDLTFNELAKIENLENLTNLRELYLKSNQVTKIENLENLTNLQTFSLSSNQLTKIENVENLTNLRELYLNSNQVTKIENLENLTNLRELRLMKNQITTLPLSIVTSKRYINLDNNTLTSPPYEIYQQGKEAMIAWWEAHEKAQQKKCNELKIILLGEGGAGKTSLVKRLCGFAFAQGESQTHGVYIQAAVLRGQQFTPTAYKQEASVPAQEDDIKIRFWDFGGQEIMHASHQFFLSKRALYILVLDNRRGDKPTYWLDKIQTLAGAQPIVVVQNKADENADASLSLGDLQAKYPNVKALHKVSCKDGSGMQAFIADLSAEIAQSEMLQTTWAASWWEVKEALENAEEPYVSIRTFQQICQEKGVEKKEHQNVLLQYLHDLGVILHFPEFELKDINVLNPSWITEAVYKIINSKRLAENKGILKYLDLEYMLNEEQFDDAKQTFTLKAEYSATEQKHIVELMKQFELCFPYNEKSVLVPNLLSVEIPKYDFDTANALKFVYDYGSSLPDMVMPRLIVKLHESINRNFLWRNGFVMERTGTFALVRRKENALHIWVNGEDKKEVLSALRYHFSVIHAPYHFKVKQLIPCNCTTCKGNEMPHFFEHGELKIELLDEEEKIRCGKSREKVLIMSLFGELRINVNTFQQEHFEKMLHLLNGLNEKVENLKPVESQAIALMNQFREEKDTPETFTQRILDTMEWKPELDTIFGKFSIDLMKLRKVIVAQWGEWRKNN